MSNPISNLPGPSHIAIRPGVRILSVLRHLNYRPWFALAEFVDNSLYSFLHNRTLLHDSFAQDAVTVRIEYFPAEGRLVIKDNASGIAATDYERAFRPAELPPDRSSLSEFGMGMKSAACWFAPRWTVKTSALGESIERTVTFNIEAIVNDNIEELQVDEKPSSPDSHFTEITLYDIYARLQTATIAKLKVHLASIFRVFERAGEAVLFFNSEKLLYKPVPVLVAPYYKTEGGQVFTWHKKIAFDFGLGQRVTGFAALRETASLSSAGFALFRRNRLIEGSGDESYRPERIFGKPNSFTYQRLFGELHIEGFEVSHTKDGFKWDESEDTFLEILREELQSTPLPLLSQAEGYRVKPKPKQIRAAARAAINSTANALEKGLLKVITDAQLVGPASEALKTALPSAEILAEQTRIVETSTHKWNVSIELSDDPADTEWLEISDRSQALIEAGKITRMVKLRISLCHPFTIRFGGATVRELEPLVRLGVALGLAEILAQDAGVRKVMTVRREVNALLGGALSAP